jgi:hypothetical protein
VLAAQRAQPGVVMKEEKREQNRRERRLRKGDVIGNIRTIKKGRRAVDESTG